MYKPTDEEYEIAKASMPTAPEPQTEAERAAQRKTAIRSMGMALFYVVLLIGVWYVIGLLVFPKDPVTKEQRIAKYVADNRPLLVQVADNAKDPTVWEGIQTTAEVQALLAQENVLLVYTTEDDDCVFSIGSKEIVEGGWLYLLYAQNGSDAFVARTEPDYPGRKAYVTEIDEQFFLIEMG